MLATFQKTIDVTLGKCHNKFALLGDILMITKSTLAEHDKITMMKELVEILYLLDKENLAKKLQKRELAKKERIS